LLVLIFLGAEVLDRLLRTGPAVPQLVEHGVDHAVVELLVFLVGAVGQGADQAAGAGDVDFSRTSVTALTSSRLSMKS
jgi:hypothetical protein